MSVFNSIDFIFTNSTFETLTDEKSYGFAVALKKHRVSKANNVALVWISFLSEWDQEHSERTVS